MALEDIKKKILSDAQSKAKDIKDENEKHMEDIRKTVDEDIRSIKTKALNSAKDKAKEKLKSALIDQNIKNSNEILKAKRKVIDDILVQVLTDLKNIDDANYQKLISSQIKKAESINFDSATILCAKEKTNIIKEVFTKDAKNIKANFLEEDDIEGGFKIKTDDSIIDLSFANLLEENRYVLESEINKLVFTK